MSFYSEYMEIKTMEFMTVKQAAEKWGLSERRLQTICNEGMIPGVVKFGRAWAIPMDAEKPIDKRIKCYCSDPSQKALLVTIFYFSKTP